MQIKRRNYTRKISDNIAEKRYRDSEIKRRTYTRPMSHNIAAEDVRKRVWEKESEEHGSLETYTYTYTEW